MSKVIIGNKEFLILEKPLSVFKTIFGANHKLVELIYQRFEVYKNYTIKTNEIDNLYLCLSEFIPMKIGFYELYLYNVFFLEHANSYKTFRHLFNLPVNGQRTWGGGRNIKFLKTQLYNYKLKKFSNFFGGSQVMFMAETVNILWKLQWNHEWRFSQKYRKHLPWYVQKKNKWLSLPSMCARRIESFFKHPYRFKKKKHHRKKKKINKHVITTGFDFGFTRFLSKNLI